jgi:hypothetical protein
MHTTTFGLIWANLEKPALEKCTYFGCVRVTYVRRPLRYRYLAIHLIVCVQYMWKHKHCSDSVAETTERTDVTGVVPAYYLRALVDAFAASQPSC